MTGSVPDAGVPVAVATGAASGIGAAVAAGFEVDGWDACYASTGPAARASWPRT